MRLAIFAAFALSFIFAALAAYYVWWQFNKDEFQIDREWKTFEKKNYEACNVMWQTATVEQQTYGLIVSGSVSNHVKDCLHCRYVMSGDLKLLWQHRDHMIKLERSWKDERRASNAT